MRWLFQGSPSQNGIVMDALDHCDFPWELLSAHEIPVEWADLSVYGAQLEAERALRARASSNVFDDGHVWDSELDHHHSGDFDPMVREVDGRSRVLGLAWYSGKVSLDTSLVANPLLAEEVFLSEAAHMTDFFWMDDPLRVAVWNAAHPDIEDLPLDANVEDAVDLGHGHGWFDVSGYYTWLGEWYMGAFVKGFSEGIPVTIEFDHPLTEEAALEVRHAFMLKILEDNPVPPSEPVPVPPIEKEGCLPRFFRSWLR